MSFAAAQYRSTRTETASPLQVLVQLYDGALKYLRRGRVAIESGDVGAKGEALSKAHAIVSELQATLDESHAPELCAQLYALYDFVLRSITQANIERSSDPLNAAENVLVELRSAWAQIAGQRG